MRLKAEEQALSQEGKKQVVKKYFQCLENISAIQGIAGANGLEKLTPESLNADGYLGLTGLGLQLAQ
jgi:hypothetical protein